MTGSRKTRSQTDRAVEDLRALIFSGELASGTDHLETELADRLGMSRTPVREATRVLEAQGLLNIRPRKGVRILSLSVRDMREIYQVLTELESLAAAIVARSGYSTGDLSPLLGAIENMEVALGQDDRETWAEADEIFHSELVRLADNSRISMIFSVFNDQLRRARNFTLHLRPLPRKSNEEHRALYEAIVAGDDIGARQIHWSHRTTAGEMLINLMKKSGMKIL